MSVEIDRALAKNMISEKKQVGSQTDCKIV